MRCGLLPALQIRAPRDTSPVTAVSNVSSNGALIFGAPIPQPYDNFNIRQ
ncbi:hypothetical protein OHA21_19480 [Actinoplanes sp. NBC_00393]